MKSSFSLSPMQSSMVFHSLAQPHSGVYLEQIIINLPEDLQISLLINSWEKIVERHPVLRTSFDFHQSKQPLQLVHEQIKLPIQQQDWRGLTTQQQQLKLEAYLEKDRHQGFDLQKAPLMRLGLFELADNNHQLVWTIHHGIIDGRSLVIVLREVFAVYEKLCNQQTINLPPVRPYQDYLDWREQYNKEIGKEYWQNLLQGFVEPTKLLLPLEGGKQGEKKYQLRYKIQQLQLDIETTHKLKKVAQSGQITLNTIIQGAWALLLARYSNSDDLVFGATRACRKSALEGMDEMVGLFVNTLPLRVQVLPETPLLPWLQELRSQWINLREYEQTSLVKIQQWSDIPPGIPLFNTIVIYEYDDLDSALKKLGDNWQQRECKLIDAVEIPLCLSAYGGEELLLMLNYDSHQFSEAIISQILTCLKVILTGIAEDPGTKTLGSIPYLTPQEKQLFLQCNNTEKVYPQDECIHHLFTKQATQTPDKLAVVFQNQTLTYQELDLKSNQLAHYLQQFDLKPDSLIGICVERSLEMIVGVMGIMKAGCAYLPLDPKLPTERLQYMLRDAQVSILITTTKVAACLPNNQANLIYLDQDAHLISQSSTTPPSTLVTPDNLAYVIYTSGSTGKPKGVQITNRSLVNAYFAWEDSYQLHKHQNHLQMANFSFDVFCGDLVRALCSGGKLVICPHDWLLMPEKLYQLMIEQNIDFAEFVPAVFRYLIEYLAATDQNLNFLRILVVGSDRWYVNEYNYFKIFCSEQTRLINSYGVTEATIDSCYFEQTKIQSLGSEQSNQLVPVGHPYNNNKLYILNEQLQPVPLGVVGELYIGGVGVAQGYLNRPQLNQEKFLSVPIELTNTEISHSEKLYKTGDSARYLKDGNIELIGRLDNQIKLRGLRIELGEIETVLVQHEQIQEAAVIVREEEGNQRLVAYLVCSSPLHNLREYLTRKLPSYMVPDMFVTLEKMPLSPNGKVNRRALPAPDYSQIVANKNIVQPQDELELQLVKIWEKVLGIQPVGINDNFFDLGGNSLLAIRLFTQIQNSLQSQISLASLFQAPTIKQLADLLRKNSTSLPPSSLVLINTGDYKPPFFFVNSITYAKKFAPYLDPEQPFYGLNIFGLTELFDEQQLATLQIADLAQLFIEDIRKVQPTGAYYLGAYCADSKLALEIAQQLKAQGEKIAFLGFIDAIWSPSQTKEISFHLNNLQEFGFSYLIEKTKNRVNNLQHKTFVLSQKIRQKLYSQTNQPVSKTMRDVSLFAKFNQISDDYQPQTYPGKITLFLSSELRVRKLPILAKIATEGFEVQEIQGLHHSIFQEPQVQFLGNKLRAQLATVQANLN